MRKPGQIKVWLTRDQVSQIAGRHALRYCVVRPRRASAGQGYATIVRTFDTKGQRIRRDISRIEVSESSFWMFVDYNQRIGVYRYLDDAEEWIHVGYLPGMWPKRRRDVSARGRRRRQLIHKGGRLYRGYRQQPSRKRAAG